MPGAVDRETFDRLVRQQMASCTRLAIRLCGDAEMAEEIVAEALYRAARGWRTFRGESTFRTWLYRIVINAHRDHCARRQSHAPLPDDVADASAGEPVAAMVGDELATSIAALVGALPPRQREVLVLVTYEQMAPAEVAVALGISRANVDATLYQARRRLRQQLRGYLGEK